MLVRMGSSTQYLYAQISASF